MMRLILSLLPLLVFIGALGFTIRGFVIGSVPLAAIVMLVLTVAYVASGAWRRFALEVRDGL